MNLHSMLEDYLDNGYSNANAISRVCQDVILLQIKHADFNRMESVERNRKNFTMIS